MQLVRVISLWQPWASLCVHGHKGIETRHWYTHHRGWIGIHAARRFGREERQCCLEPTFGSALCSHYQTLGDIPTGALLGFARLVACGRMYWNDGLIDIGPQFRHLLTVRELLFGNYDWGRYAWVLQDAFALEEPIPLVGRQGIFTVDASGLPIDVAARVGARDGE